MGEASIAASSFLRYCSAQLGFRCATEFMVIDRRVALGGDNAVSVDVVRVDDRRRVRPLYDVTHEHVLPPARYDMGRHLCGFLRIPGAMALRRACWTHAVKGYFPLRLIRAM
jgi:hypothetical protein